MHKAQVIHDPKEFAEKITHPDLGEQERLRKLFVHQNQVEYLGANGIAFSVICCDDPKTVSRHTTFAHKLSAEELGRVMERHVKQSSEAHEASLSHKEHFKRLKQK